MYTMKFWWAAKAYSISMFAVVATMLLVAVAVPSVAAANDSSSQLVLNNTDDGKQPTPAVKKQPAEPAESAESETSEPGKLSETSSSSSTSNSSGISTLKIVPEETKPLEKTAQLQQPALGDKSDRPSQNPVEEQSQKAALQTGGADSPEQSLKPIPDPKLIPGQKPTGPATIETASFKGVTPGETTLDQLEKAWGAPREIRAAGVQKILLFAVGPFKQVEVAVGGKKVVSIVIQLEKPFPSGAVIKQLQLSNVRPVFISNELGDVLGQAFPERGVMFAFVQNHEPGRPSMNVDKIVLEPIDAEAFILRAETNLDSHYERTLEDLETAAKLSPQNAKTQWLRSRVLTAMGKTKEAVAAAEKAVQLDDDDPQYLVSLAKVLAQAGQLKKAIEYAKVAVQNSNHRPHIKAGAQCLLGDLFSSSEKPDFTTAIKYHMAAIKTADPLSVDRHPAIRLAAKEVLIDAHLGAANDIAWGSWSQKEKAVAKWSQRAAAFAEELIANDGGTEELRFRVATRSLAAFVGVKGKIDPRQYAKEAARVGDELIDRTNDPLQKRQLQCDLGMAMFNAMQVAQARKDNASALEYGKKTAGYMETAIEQGLDNPISNYLLGRLYFRIGAIHALAKKDHAAAIAWFDKSVPLLGRPVPADSKNELGRHGETFVSMGVSYWATGEKKKALELTKVGLALMKEAVEVRLLKKSALAVPYQNLAAMQHSLGNGEAAYEFERLAKSVAVARTAKHSTPRKNIKKTVKR